MNDVKLQAAGLMQVVFRDCFKINGHSETKGSQKETTPTSQVGHYGPF